MSFVSFRDWTDAMGNELIEFEISEKVGDKVKPADQMYYENVLDVTQTKFNGWLVRIRNDRDRALMGIDNRSTHTLRVDVILYSSVLSLKNTDEIKRVSDGVKFKIVKVPDVSSYLDMIRFEVMEVK